MTRGYSPDHSVELATLLREGELKCLWLDLQVAIWGRLPGISHREIMLGLSIEREVAELDRIDAMVRALHGLPSTIKGEHARETLLKLRRIEERYEAEIQGCSGGRPSANDNPVPHDPGAWLSGLYTRKGAR